MVTGNAAKKVRGQISVNGGSFTGFTVQMDSRNLHVPEILGDEYPILDVEQLPAQHLEWSGERDATNGVFQLIMP